MRIRSRIVLSNILMVLIPLALIYLVVRMLPGLIINLYGDWTPGNSAFPVQGLIHDTLKEEGSLPEEVIEELESKGYRLQITLGEEVLYSTIGEDMAALYAPEMKGPVSSMVSISRETAVIRESIPVKGHKMLSVLAINPEYRSNPLMEERIKQSMKLLTPVTLLISLIAISLTNKVLSNKILESIAQPLELLQLGTRRIRDGQLDFQLSYSGKDEFCPVFDDFEEMRQRLLDSVNSQLKQEESRKELLAGISHDLRTPLTVIKGYAEGLRDGVAVTPEKQEKYLTTIYNKACEMDKLVDQLFLFSKLDTGRYPFDFEQEELGRFLNGFASMAAEEFACQGLRVTVEGTEKELPVWLDKTEFSRVLVNLLSNSAKYSRCSAPSCHLSLKGEGNWAVLQVSDNGEGVAEENLEKLFDSFFREDVSRTSPDKGSGLGLSIAKRIIDAHGGMIRAWNNGGLTVEIRIPLRKEENP